jgi:hypothetical protein
VDKKLVGKSQKWRTCYILNLFIISGFAMFNSWCYSYTCKSGFYSKHCLYCTWNSNLYKKLSAMLIDNAIYIPAKQASI